MTKHAKDLDPTIAHYKAMVVGDYGSGKSVFAASFPQPGFVFDFDKGIKTYREGDWEYEQFSYSSKGWIDFEKCLREVKQMVADGKFKTVILDSTTTMTDVAMERAMQIDPVRSETDGPVWNVHYQHVRNLMEPKLRQFMNWPVNFVMTSHLKIDTDQKTGAVLKIEPLLTGQLGSKVPGYFDEVYYSTTKMVEGQTKYVLRTVRRGFYGARSRLSGKARILPDTVPNDYPTLMEIYRKEMEKREGSK